MRFYLSIIALAICICAVSSRSLRTFLNEDDSNDVQQEINRRNRNQALLFNRLRKLLDSDDEITNARDIQSQSDESNDQDDIANVRRNDDSDSDSVEVARKKRQLDDANNGDDNNNNNNNDESDSSDSDENGTPQSGFQDKQASDDLKDSDEENENQSNLPNRQASDDLKYSDEENENQSNNQASDDTSEEVDDD
jgi:hypothetical protein